MNETPKYATLLYEVRKSLDISIAEYFYIDMVYHLSHDRWCIKSLDNIGEDMGITKNGVVQMRDRLIKRGLVKKNHRGHVKTTDTYNKVVLTSKEQQNTYNKVIRTYNKVVPSVQLSGTKNYKEGTKEIKSVAEKEIERRFIKRPSVLPDFLINRG